MVAFFFFVYSQSALKASFNQPALLACQEHYWKTTVRIRPLRERLRPPSEERVCVNSPDSIIFVLKACCIIFRTISHNLGSQAGGSGPVWKVCYVLFQRSCSPAAVTFHYEINNPKLEKDIHVEGWQIRWKYMLFWKSTHPFPPQSDGLIWSVDSLSLPCFSFLSPIQLPFFLLSCLSDEPALIQELFVFWGSSDLFKPSVFFCFFLSYLLFHYWCLVFQFYFLPW